MRGKHAIVNIDNSIYLYKEYKYLGDITTKAMFWLLNYKKARNIIEISVLALFKD